MRILLSEDDAMIGEAVHADCARKATPSTGCATAAAEHARDERSTWCCSTSACRGATGAWTCSGPARARLATAR